MYSLSFIGVPSHVKSKYSIPNAGSKGDSTDSKDIHAPKIKPGSFHHCRSINCNNCVQQNFLIIL